MIPFFLFRRRRRRRFRQPRRLQQIRRSRYVPARSLNEGLSNPFVKQLIQRGKQDAGKILQNIKAPSIDVVVKADAPTRRTVLGAAGLIAGGIIGGAVINKNKSK